MRGTPHLFSGVRLEDMIRQKHSEMSQEIDSLASNYILSASVEDLCDYLEDKYRYQVPALKIDEIYVDNKEVVINVSQDGNQPAYVKGISITFAVPFEGDPDLFRCKPVKYSSVSPVALVVSGDELHFKYERPDHNASAIRSEFDRQLYLVQQYLGWSAESVTDFNTNLRETAHRRIELRREKLLMDQGMMAALGFPMKRTEDIPSTYNAQIVRRKSPVPRPVITTAPYIPEPALEMQEYEHILSIIHNMSLVVERSPRAFSAMDEESLRHHFLVVLNSHYQGGATGETFNFEGKTDILIRVDGRNIFIAECKFWRGAESLRRTIDQLLGYASWRDTKTAIVMLNRNKNLSDVLAQIPGIATAHPNFKRQVNREVETEFRFVFHQRDDVNREVMITVLIFEVPT